jgi:thiamine biosynthesis lipoprotein
VSTTTLGATHDFEIWTMSGRLVVTDPAALRAATRIVRRGLAEIEQACSRFRPDSELNTITNNPRRPTTVSISPVLADLVSTALEAAERSDGLVDPTVGAAMQQLGYDRSIELLPADASSVRLVSRVPGWRDIRLAGDQLELPVGVLLDLGATAKARAADLIATRVRDQLGVGVLVELGGDIATAAPVPSTPRVDEGHGSQDWQVLVHDTAEDPACQVTLRGGSALATSSTVRRTWRRAGVRLHHILDPRTAAPAAPVWRSVTVADATCVDANTASTAAVVLGLRAPTWLAERGFSARLVDQQRRIVRVGDWPTETAA